MENKCFHIASWSVLCLTTMMQILGAIVLQNSMDKASLEQLNDHLNTLKGEIHRMVGYLKNLRKRCELYPQLRSSSTVSQGRRYLASPNYSMNPASKVYGSFDCTDEFHQMDRFFKGGDETIDLFRSLTLYGSCGTSQSIVAWQYVQNKFRNNELDYVFWVAMDEIANTFTHFAMELQLHCANPKRYHDDKIFFSWLPTIGEMVIRQP